MTDKFPERCGPCGKPAATRAAPPPNAAPPLRRDCAEREGR